MSFEVAWSALDRPRLSMPERLVRTVQKYSYEYALYHRISCLPASARRGWNAKKGTLTELKEKYPDVWNHWVVIEGRTTEYLSVWISQQKNRA